LTGLTVDEIVRIKGIDEDDEDYEDDEEDEDDEDEGEDNGEDDDEGDDEDDDEDEDEEGDDDDNVSLDKNQDMGSFWSSSPAGKLDSKYLNQPDYSVVRNPNPDLSDIPKDALVTEEDTKALRKAHRRADRIMEYAADVSLIASFHYKKKNFHLVKMLEPIFIIGKRIDDIKGMD
jgi:hypothetical protein